MAVAGFTYVERNRLGMMVRQFNSKFMTQPDADTLDARLRGVECSRCGVVLFGIREICENCGNNTLDHRILSTTGEIYSYTVQRHPPPEPYKLGSTDDTEWEPRPIAYVDLRDGARLLSPIEADPDEISIGDEVELVVRRGWREQAETVCVYSFRPV